MSTPMNSARMLAGADGDAGTRTNRSAGYRCPGAASYGDAATRPG
jgi:hypothetical protein